MRCPVVLPPRADRVDFIVVLESVISLILLAVEPSSSLDISALRGLRVLRPLRAITYIQQVNRRGAGGGGRHAMHWHQRCVRQKACFIMHVKDMACIRASLVVTTCHPLYWLFRYTMKIARILFQLEFGRSPWVLILFYYSPRLQSDVYQARV